MKLLLRTLIILAAGVLVTGALLAFGRSGMATQMREAGPRGGRFEGRGGPPPGFEGQGGFAGQPEGGFEGREGHGGRGGPSLRGLPEAIGNLVKIGIVVTLVVLATRLLRAGRKDPPTTEHSGTPTRL
jgi:hypothetical protein